MVKGKVFILECPNALELVAGTGEAGSLQQVCTQFGHDAHTFMLRDADDLKRSLSYIGSGGWLSRPPKAPVFIHLSMHGARGKGLSLGQEEVHWDKLGEMLVAMLEGMHFHGNGYPGPTIIVISACDSEKQSLTQYLSRAVRNEKLNLPPSYVFLIADDEVFWMDALVTWTIFYRWVLDVNLRVGGEAHFKAKQFIKNLKQSKYGNLSYFRWCPEKREFRRFPKRND